MRVALRLVKLYLNGLMSLHKNILRLPLNRLIRSEHPKISVAAANLNFFLKRSKLRISFDYQKKLFCVKDGDRYHFFGNLERGLDLYSDGLEARARKLFNSYLLGNIKFADDDIVIDCGANYGDLWLSFKTLINERNYITFEPGLREHLSIIENSPGGIHNLKGLSASEGISKFFVNERSADSSVVEPKHFSHVVEVETTNLSKCIHDNEIGKVKLFKLEAEGYEPEIIAGSLKVLDKIEYIALDGGYERGPAQAETFTDLCNTLYGHGFELVAVNFKWARALFVNRKMDRE